MKIKKIAVITLMLSVWLNPAGKVSAQISIIEQMIDSQSSLVMIKAEITQHAAAERQEPIVNPQTGQIFDFNNLKTASYFRYGAGVIIDASGIVITNAHIVAGAGRVVVKLNDNAEFYAKIVRYVNDLDLALLKINASQPLIPVELGDSDAVQLKDEIINVGNSEFLKKTISAGKVTGLGTSGDPDADGKHPVMLIRTSLNLYKGDSGGPLFDYKGQLIGLMTAQENQANHSSFAVPANKIKEYLLSYQKEMADPAQQTP